MSLDISLVTPVGGVEKFEYNITHNLGPMARMAGLYEPIWRPEEKYPAPVFAADLIADVERGRDYLKDHADECRKLNPDNGWGDYEGLVAFVEEYLAALHDNKTCYVKAWR